MPVYQKVLIGRDGLDLTWREALAKINAPEIILSNFSDPDEVVRQISWVDWVIPLTVKDYTQIRDILPSPLEKILFPSPEIYHLLDNKLAFTHFMMRHFVHLLPKVYYIDNVCLTKDITFPVISKPVFSTNGANMKIYHNENQFRECQDRKIIQQFVQDPNEYSAFMLCINGIIKNTIILRNKYPPYHIKKKNFPKTCDRVHDFDISIFTPLLQTLQYSGGVNIDFKYDPTTEQILIFEMNPRFGGSAFTLDFIQELLCIMG